MRREFNKFSEPDEQNLISNFEKDKFASLKEVILDFDERLKRIDTAFLESYLRVYGERT